MTQSNDLLSIFTLNRIALARYVSARLRVKADVDDILQDIWIKISMLDGRPVTDPLAYLYRTVENLVRDRHRSAQSRVNREQEWTRGTVDSLSDAAIDPQPSAERIALARDHLRFVNTVLETLPEQTVHIFRAVRLEGRSQNEIAETLGVSLSSVEKHLQKAYRLVLGLQTNLNADMDEGQRLSIEEINPR